MIQWFMSAKGFEHCSPVIDYENTKVKMQDTEHIQLIFQLSHIIHVSKVYLPTFGLFFDGSFMYTPVN